MLKHYIIIRFNYPKGYPHLKERIHHFNNYTLKSLEYQLNHNFTLVILASPGMKENFLGPHLQEFKTVMLYPQPHTPIYKVKDFDRELVIRFIRNDLQLNGMTSTAHKIITTRLDNDDMLLPNYVRNIQILAKLQADETVMDLKGYWYDLRTNKVFFNIRYTKKLTSPLLSFVEAATGKFLTAYVRKHSDMGKLFNCVESQARGWVQMLHGTNQLMNKLTTSELGTETSIEKIPGFLRGSEEDEDYQNYLSQE